MKKNTFWQNQGHSIEEVYLDEINRVYIESGNLFVVAGAITGIETENEIIKNERIRLIIPLDSAINFMANLNQAVSVLTSHMNSDIVPPEIIESPPETKNQQKVLGKPFTVGP